MSEQVGSVELYKEKVALNTQFDEELLEKCRNTALWRFGMETVAQQPKPSPKIEEN